MKYYEIVDLKIAETGGDDWTIWEGIDFSEALLEKEKAIENFKYYLTPKEKQTRKIECRVWELPDDIDLKDKDEIINAKCEIACFNEF